MKAIVRWLAERFGKTRVDPSQPLPLDVACPVCEKPIGLFCDATSAACHLGRYEASPAAHAERKAAQRSNEEKPSNG